METTARNVSSFPSADAAGEVSSARGAQAAIDKAAANAHSAVDKAASVAQPAIDRAAQAAHSAVDKAAGAAGPAVDWVGEKSEQLRSTQKKVVDDTSNYISAHPLKSVGLAAAIGFLIGRVVR